MYSLLKKSVSSNFLYLFIEDMFYACLIIVFATFFCLIILYMYR